MSKQMERTGNKNERSASGKKQRIQEICSPVTAVNDLIVLKGCIMLHSVSALPVQACEMRQVVTSYLYSVTRGEMSGMDEAKSLFDTETQLALLSRYSNVRAEVKIKKPKYH